jgi:hypothetical protein
LVQLEPKVPLALSGQLALKVLRDKVPTKPGSAWVIPALKPNSLHRSLAPKVLSALRAHKAQPARSVRPDLPVQLVLPVHKVPLALSGQLALKGLLVLLAKAPIRPGSAWEIPELRRNSLLRLLAPKVLPEQRALKALPVQWVPQARKVLPVPSVQPAHKGLLVLKVQWVPQALKVLLDRSVLRAHKGPSD